MATFKHEIFFDRLVATQENLLQTLLFSGYDSSVVATSLGVPLEVLEVYSYWWLSG